MEYFNILYANIIIYCNILQHNSVYNFIEQTVKTKLLIKCLHFDSK